MEPRYRPGTYSTKNSSEMLNLATETRLAALRKRIKRERPGD